MVEALLDETLEQLTVSAMAELCVRREGADLLCCPPSLAGVPVQPPSPVQTHVPAFPELIYVLGGSLGMVTPVGTLRLVPGQLLLVSPGVEHGEVWEGEYDVIFLPIQHTNVQFYRRRPPPAGVLSVYLLGRTNLDYIADALIEELQDRDLEYEDSVYSLLLHLRCLLRRRLLRGSFLYQPWIHSPHSADAHSWAVVQHALSYLSVHFREPIDAQDIARETGYSLAHLNRFALRFLGRSISKCLRDLRMTHARDLLRHSDLSVAEIADRVGYSDPSNFRRAFKQVTGAGLKEYRRGQVSWP